MSASGFNMAALGVPLQLRKKCNVNFDIGLLQDRRVTEQQNPTPPGAPGCVRVMVAQLGDSMAAGDRVPSSVCCSGKGRAQLGGS